MSDHRLLELTANIVSSHISHNPVQTDALPTLIAKVYGSLTEASLGKTQPEPAKPAVPLKSSVFNDRLVCLECGKSFRVLRRHVQTEHNMTLDAYRQKFSLPREYPFVAPQYAEVRSALAKKIGLGRSGASRHTRRLPAPKKGAAASRRSA